MKARPFEALTDYPIIEAWSRTRGLPPVSPAFIPATGAIVPGNACGFLVATDTHAALLAWLMTDPEADSAVRGRGLSVVINHLTEDARRLGFTALLASIGPGKTYDRLVSHGFVPSGPFGTTLVKALHDGEIQTARAN